jgi:hypothetical protein
MHITTNNCNQMHFSMLLIRMVFVAAVFLLFHRPIAASTATGSSSLSTAATTAAPPPRSAVPDLNLPLVADLNMEPRARRLLLVPDLNVEYCESSR